jgi:hypothetical protein
MNVTDGWLITMATRAYRTGVIERALPGSGGAPPRDWALRHPGSRPRPDDPRLSRAIIGAARQALSYAPSDVGLRLNRSRSR